MSNYTIYAQAIDDAVLEYERTEDTNYPVTNLQDRSKNTFFKDSAIGETDSYIVIDLGAARSCTHIFLGNYLATGNNDVLLKLDAHSADAWVGAETVAFANTSINSATLTDKVITFSAQNFRYWKLTFSDDGGDLINLQIASLFLGTSWNWAHEPELRKPDSSGYIVNGTEAGGGDRFSQIAGTTVRRIWGIPVEWNGAAEVVKMETFRDQIFMDSRNGLSRYPFYFTDDGGTTFYYSRYRGKLHLEQQAYQQWKVMHTFEEEL